MLHEAFIGGRCRAHQSGDGRRRMLRTPEEIIVDRCISDKAGLHFLLNLLLSDKYTFILLEHFKVLCEHFLELSIVAL
jgi:hypothetical protein